MHDLTPPVGRGAWSVERGAWSVGRGAWGESRAASESEGSELAVIEKCQNEAKSIGR